MAMAQRPLVRAYGIVTGHDPQEIREVEKRVIRSKMARTVVWFGKDAVNNARPIKTSLDTIKKDTPLFAEALEAYAQTDIVKRLN